MKRVLILFAHPVLEKSRIHRRLVEHVPSDVTVHDLYEEYPAYDIDIEREQALLEAHDVVVMQHPFYWYSTPPLLKQWQDLVLEHGWAYGTGGRALEGRWLVNAISAGGMESAYRHGGYNRYTVRELLAPIEQTARLCHMTYLPPWMIFGAHRLDPPDIVDHAAEYARVLDVLRAGRVDLAAAKSADTLNEIVKARA